MNDDHIALDKGGGVTFVGPDATWLFRAKTIKIGLSLMIRTGMQVTRGATKTKFRTMVSEYTGKTYKRGQEPEALKDIEDWILTMESAMPIVDNR